MKTIVINDSHYGNTEQIARAIATGAGGHAIRATQEEAVNWDEVGVIIVGSPTQGGRPTEVVQHFLARIPDHVLRGKTVAAFDTRFEEASQKFPLRMLMKTIKYAAEKTESALIARGGVSAGAMGFIVTGKEGPLKRGELERAKEWGRTLVKSS